MSGAGFGAATVQFGYPQWPQSSSQGVLMLSGDGSTVLLTPGSFLYAPDSSSNISAVPEPTTALLVLGGLALLGLQSRRSRRVIPA